MNLNLPTEFKLDKEGRQNLKEIASKLPPSYAPFFQWTKGEYLLRQGIQNVDQEGGLTIPVKKNVKYRVQKYRKVNHFHNLKELFRCFGSDAVRKYVADVTGDETLRNKSGIIVVGSIGEYVRKQKEKSRK